MYTLYIVDDDPVITKGLSINIPWKDYGISVAGVARNGVEALNMMDIKTPDIVISDVKMPQMDGIELAKNIHNKYPKTRILLLSAYDEFSYVRDALSLRVVDYLLKPVDNSSILDTILKAVKAMESERKLESSLKEHFPVMRQDFLSRLSEGYYKDENIIRSQIEFLELPLTADYFISAVIKLDEPDFYGDSAEERELLRFTVGSIVKELMENELRLLSYTSGEENLGLIFYAPVSNSNNLSSFISNVKTFLEKILETIEISLKTTVTIGHGNCYKGFLGIYRSNVEACSSIKHSHLIGINHVYEPDALNMPFESSLTEYNTYIENLIGKVLTFQEEEAYAAIDKFSEEIRKRLSTSVDYLKMLFSEVMFALIREVNRNYGDKPEFRKINLFDYYKKVNKANTLDKMVLYLKEMITALFTIGSSSRISSKSILVSQAVKYITDNYADDKLSLEKVARSINVTPIYLSLIFKKEKGVNFITFLFNLRMNKAIELLRLNDLRTYELAEMVGYKNPNYFGMCFKKFTGCTPSQWKEKENERTL